MLCVIGAITPPLGLNVYVMKGALGKEVKLEEIFAGALPFVFLMVLITIILSIYPQISLFLPNLMMGK
jgi:TRAP-type mannitol/chloroaromatic compound transport system permease large subunit